MIRVLMFALTVFMFSCNAKVKDGKKVVGMENQDVVKVLMTTNYGDIEIDLDAKNAPITVKNFLAYADNGFYNGTIFHRVIRNFMIQGGGFEEGMKKKDTNAPIKNEATNKLPNQTGTIAMARTSVIDSATSQFFINTKDNVSLDHKNTSDAGFGYAVFGKVSKGMDVVKRIEMTQTTSAGMFRDVPVEPIVIKSVKRL